MRGSNYKAIGVSGCLAAALCLGAVAPVKAGLPGLDSQGQALPSLAPMLENVTDSVVNISTRHKIDGADNPLFNDPFFRRFFGLPDPRRVEPPQALGSGVIVNADKGYVLTNAHVIQRANEIVVTLRDGRALSAKLIGVDAEADVAVVQVEADNLTDIKIADSDKLRVGDFVVAIGNPFGLTQTVTSGIVSALGRSGLGIEGYEDFIQTDASINPGNSGGPLVNLRGELVGINTAIVAPSGGNVGIGFAIPSNMAVELMNQLVEYGEVRRGRLGIGTQTLTPELAQAFGFKWQEGALISGMEQESAAANAGLQVGDLVVAVEGRAIKDTAGLRNAIGLVRAGESVPMTVIRDGKKMTLNVLIADPASEQFVGEELSARLTGVTFGAIRRESPLYGEVDGLQVLDVRAGTQAWAAGLKKDDVLIAVNQHPVGSKDGLAKALKGKRHGVTLTVRRGNRVLFVLL